jgi:hypothetical protein
MPKALHCDFLSHERMEFQLIHGATEVASVPLHVQQELFLPT